MESLRSGRPFLLVVFSVFTVIVGGGSALLGVCGPFTDVAADAFCPFVREIFYFGITTGTTPTTYDPSGNVSRLQMAAFLSRTVDGVLSRGSRRSALGQFWTPQGPDALGITMLGGGPNLAASDGADIWTADGGCETVSRVRASDGKLLETWTGAPGGYGVLSAMGRIFITGFSTGNLYQIDPRQPAGAVTIVTSSLGFGSRGIAFDGSRIWTANSSVSVSIVTPGPTIPWTVTTITTGFVSPYGALYDGANVWVTDFMAAAILKLDSSGAIVSSVPVGVSPLFPAFDGANIWVPNLSVNSVSVVRASSGAVLQTLTGNGLSYPIAAAFDGSRVLITNGSFLSSVSLWKAADLTPIGSFPTGNGTQPSGVCSDGVNFWVVLNGSGQLAKF